MNGGENKNKQTQPKKLLQILCVVFIFMLMTVLTSHFCFALSSANYQISEDILTSGGGRSTSTNYTIDTDYIGDEIAIIEYDTRSERPSGGGGEPPPPPPPIEDTTPPAISNVKVLDITDHSARITWLTNENSSTEVDFGVTLTYELGTRTGLNGVLEHEVILLGLYPNTLYHFRVRSEDALGNSNASLDYTFTTLADTTTPIISNITVTNITGTSAIINWTTNELATSVVNYGETMAYEIGPEAIGILEINHSVAISNLNPATLYHFRVRSVDTYGNEAVSGDQIFATLDTAPPIISNILIKNITSNSATIEWFTNEISTGLVNYGITPSYEAGISISEVFSMSHELDLSGLVGNTIYHFRITVADPAGNEATSTDFIFKTERDSVPPSNVLNFQAEPGETYIILSWDNPPDVDFAGIQIMRGETTYPTSIEEGVVVFRGLATSAVDRGLTPGTIYFYTAFSYDTSDNLSSGAIVSATTLGEIVPPEVIPPEVILPEIAPITPIELKNVSFFVAEETISLPIIDNQIKTILGTGLLVTISDENFDRLPETIILKIGNSNYLFSYNGDKKRYETKITAPLSFGKYGGAISTIYDKEVSDFIDFTLFADSNGLIFEILGGEEKPVDDAFVTLYSRNTAGNWEIWSAGPFNQTNPVLTAENGTYYFFVPQGLYYLVVEKDGYRRAGSPTINARDGIINKKIEILKFPTKPLEYITFVAKVAKEEILKIIDDPRVEENSTKIAVPTIATAVVVNASTAISLLSFLNYLRFLLTQPFLLLERRKRKGWGSVYHAFTKLPVELAIVRLRDAKTKRILQTRVTDRQGRFAFIVSSGKYLIEVTKLDFIFPTKTIKRTKEDAGIKDIYYGGIITVGKEGETIMVNIPIEPVEEREKVVPRKIILKKYLKMFNRTIAFSGVSLSLVAFIITPTVLLGGFFVAQILLYLLFKRLAVTKKPKAWGIVYDRKTRKPISYTITRLFETEYNKLLETQITDGRGRYVFLAGRNVYYATFEKKGYEPRKTDQINLTKAAKENVVALDIGLNQKKSK